MKVYDIEDIYGDMQIQQVPRGTEMKIRADGPVNTATFLHFLSHGLETCH